MRIGRMRHRVEVQQATETQDEYGEYARSWATIKTRWAAIEPLTGREMTDAQQVVATVSHRLRMRHDADLTPKMRLKFGARIFGIGAVTNLNELGREMWVLCTEEVDV